MRNTARRDTPCELALRSQLHRRGLRYYVDWSVPGSRRRADIVFVKARVLVFVDGCFWHVCPLHATWPKANADWWRAKLLANVERDRDTDVRLTAAGWVIVRVWEHEHPPTAAARIVDAVSSATVAAKAK